MCLSYLQPWWHSFNTLSKSCSSCKREWKTKSLLLYQHPFCQQSPAGIYSIFHFMVTHKYLLLQGWKKSGGIVEKVEQVLWWVEKYKALQYGSVGEGRGAVGVVGDAKATQEKEKSRAKRRAREKRQNVGYGVFGASHGYRSENGAAGPRGNLTLQQAWVIISCSLQTSHSNWPFLAVKGVWGASGSWTGLPNSYSVH